MGEACPRLGPKGWSVGANTAECKMQAASSAISGFDRQMCWSLCCTEPRASAHRSSMVLRPCVHQLSVCTRERCVVPRSANVDHGGLRSIGATNNLEYCAHIAVLSDGGRWTQLTVL